MSNNDEDRKALRPENTNSTTSQFDIGLMLGEIISETRGVRETQSQDRVQRDRMEQQQYQILSANEQLASEVTRLATEIVDVRDRVGKLESGVAQAVHIPMRPRLPSFSDEDKHVQVESMRVQASELPEQTKLLRETKETNKKSGRNALLLTIAILFGEVLSNLTEIAHFLKH